MTYLCNIEVKYNPPPHLYRYDLTDDVNEAVQLMYTTPYKYTV